MDHPASGPFVAVDPDQACAALDMLAAMRLRTAPHTDDSRRLHTDLRARFRVKRPADALA